MAENAKRDYRQVLTDKLIEQLESGTAPWQKPWDARVGSDRLPFNPTTGKPYRGANSLYLSAVGMEKGYSDPRWTTYKQADAQGWQVRKGEKGALVEYWKFSERQQELDSTGKPIIGDDGQPKMIDVMLEKPQVFRAVVFNAQQMDNVPELSKAPRMYEWDPDARAEAILKSSGARIYHDQADRAFYSPSKDEIHLPAREQFKSQTAYYSTALHELGHWTGHEQRLGRNFGGSFGSIEYAKEELRAELSSYFMADKLGVPHEPGQHAAYVKSWVKVLQEDKNEIFRAARDAEKITDYVLALDRTRELELGQGEQRDVGGRAAGSSVAQGLRPHEVEQERERELATERTALQVPFKEKDAAKALGAKWDKDARAWYAPEGTDLKPLEKWVPKATGLAVADGERTSQQEQSPPELKKDSDLAKPEPAGRTWLAVPFSEKGLARDAGAKWDKGAKSWYAPEGADLAKVERWKPENVKVAEGPAVDPREEFRLEMMRAGLVVAKDKYGDHPIMDGKPHRVPVNGGKAGAADGFYVGGLDGVPAGRIINNKTGVDVKWVSNTKISEEELAKIRAQAAEKTAQKALEQEEIYEATAQRINRQLAQQEPAQQSTPYMKAKGIDPAPGVLTDKTGRTTFIPAMDVDGKVWTVQYIQEDGTKRFAKDSRKEGGFHPIGGLEALAAAPVLVIAEGYATAKTISQALGGMSTVAAFDSGNLESVAKTLHAKYPEKPIIIAGDDDRHLLMTHGKNPGREKAEGAALAVGGQAVFPGFKPQDNTYPENLPKITPESYKAHLEAAQILADVSAGKVDIPKADLERAVASRLSDSQMIALAGMKRHTDFNDLQRADGVGVVKGQLDAALAQAVEKSRQQASGIAKTQLGNDAEVKAPGQNTRHTGEVLGVTGYHAAQATGRNAAVVHAVADLDRRPEPGKVATIQYRDGRGQVQERAVHQQKRQELQR